MGAGTPGGPGGRGGFITPGGPGPGIRPPKEGDGPGIRPPKSEPTPPPRDDGRPGIRPPKPPKENKSPEIFDKLLEGIKKSGGLPGGPRPRGGKPFGGRGGKPIVSRPAPGSNIPLGPDDRPIGFERPRDESDFITEFGDTRDPNYAENKRKALEEKYGRPMGSGALSVDFPRPPRDIGLGGGPGIPPRFPTGPRDPRAMRGPRREAVTFRGKPSSMESRRPTKEGPKGGMSKAGPVDAETRNKFEEMLAYMKSFQR